MAKVSFNNNKSPFFKSLKTKVDRYFADHQMQQSGNTKLYFKSMLQILSALTLYIVLVFFTPGVFISLLLCGLLGMNLAFIGFNIMHEGGHQSFSRYKWLNRASAYSLNVMGGNAYFWQIKHNINHHTYTNIEGMDSDIDIKPFMRLHEEQPRYWFHRFQHIYWIFFYGISYFAWIFYQDFEKYFTGKISAGNSSRKLSPKEHVIFWLTKITYMTIYLIFPMLMVGWIPAMVGFMTVSLVCGLFISIVFQLAHVVENTHFPVPNSQSHKIEQEWAIHQVVTTSDFATNSKVLSWFLGGLNFQVEHHLFPKISHIHYPVINKFVKETCQEFNVAYNEYPTFIKAFHSHLLHLRRLGSV
ncbi:acyl-CoA desaturase [Catalinimonas sp. 4WD22]|uniref:fatty acid desaturase family protein n=1 Tax=Catalinimonas locisalis TaxID=3133978 RepID=UPI00310112C6